MQKNFKHFFILIAAMTLLSSRAAEIKPSAPENPEKIEAVVLRVSKIPESSKSVYPDCNYAVRVQTGGKILCLIIPAFRNRTAVKGTVLKSGDLIRVPVLPEDKMSPKEKSIELADDINDFENEIRYVPSAAEIQLVGAAGKIEESKAAPPEKKVSASPEAGTSPKQRAYWKQQPLRQKTIAANTRRLQEILAAHEGVEKWNESIRPLYEMCGKNPSCDRWVNGAFFSTWRKEDFKPNYIWTVSALPNIREVDEFCRRHFIDLVVVPVPKPSTFALSVLYPESLSRDRIADPGYYKHLLELSENQIYVVDVYDLFLKNYSKHPLLYLPEDHHLAYGGQELLAAHLAEIVRTYDFPVKFRPGDLKLKALTHQELFGKKERLPDGFRPARPVQYPVVLQPDGKPLQTTTPGESIQICFAGDSILRVPDIDAGCSLSAVFCYQTGFEVITYHRSSGARHVLNRLMREEKNLKNIRVVFMVYIADYADRVFPYTTNKPK